MISVYFKARIIAYFLERRQYAYDNGLVPKNYPKVELEFGNFKTNIGYYRHRTIRIYISEPNMRYAKWEAVVDVINHELAHWAERRGKVHGIEWQRMAIRFGIEPNRVSDYKNFEYPHLVMFKNEIVGASIDEYDLTDRYIYNRKRETLNKLHMMINPNVIDNSIYGM